MCQEKLRFYSNENMLKNLQKQGEPKIMTIRVFYKTAHFNEFLSTCNGGFNAEDHFGYNVSHAEILNQALQVLLSSPTGRRLYNHLSGSQDIRIVIFPGGNDTLFMSPSLSKDIIGKETGIVSVQPELLLNELDPDRSKPDSHLLAASIAHELGHAHQFLEHKEWYEDNFKKSAENEENKCIIESHCVKFYEHPVCNELGLKTRDNYVQCANVNAYDYNYPRELRL